MVEDLLAARGIIVCHQTVRLWAEKFGPTFCQPDPSSVIRSAWGQVASRGSRCFNPWQEALAVARSRSGRFRVGRPRAKPPKCQGRQAPDAQALEGPGTIATGDDHRQAAIIRRSKARDHAGCRASLPQGVNNRAENSQPPVLRRERIMKRFKSRRHRQRFVSIHDPIANLFHIPRHDITSGHHRELRAEAMSLWAKIARE